MVHEGPDCFEFAKQGAPPTLDREKEIEFLATAQPEVFVLMQIEKMATIGVQSGLSERTCLDFIRRISRDARSITHHSNPLIEETDHA